MKTPTQAELEESMRELIKQGYQQTSSKYRTLARLPVGMSGVEALKEYAPDEYRRIVKRIEQQCASTYRRMYARHNGDELELTEEGFRAFKKAGGETSW